MPLLRLGFDGLRADIIFAFRLLRRHAITSIAAALSLALAIGACSSAFRLIDALLLRPLPVDRPERLYALSRASSWPDGQPSTSEGWEYPLFAQMRELVKGDAELLAISYAERVDVTLGATSASDVEKAWLQYVSGTMFDAFGLRPALGRLLHDADDRTPGAHPYAVISHDYWTRRFAQDPSIIGRTFRLDTGVFEIVGVAPAPFTGTEPGTITDIFVPTMMNRAVARANSTWVRTLAIVEPGKSIEPLRERLDAMLRAFLAERAKGFTGMPPERVALFRNQHLLMDRASTGVSWMQRQYGRALTVLAVLVALVLLIACANVANLMTAQTAARAREMAVRVAIGAGRWRLVRMVLIESACLAGMAGAMGAIFAWWSAPLVVGWINPPDNPARLVLPADWRAIGFGLGLTAVVTCLFGLAPALRTSAIDPVNALKGGSGDGGGGGASGGAGARRRTMHTLIAVQVAFCVLVLFVCGLLVSSFDRLAHQPTGFSSERLVTLDTEASSPQASAFWNDVADRLRTVAGVEAVALSDRPLLDGSGSNSFVSIDGAPPGQVLAFFRRVSPGWLDVMKIPFIEGRDIDASDTAPGVAIVNETFAKQFFGGRNPIGHTFEATYRNRRFRIIGLVRDARYRTMREPMLPAAYVPFQSTAAADAGAEKFDRDAQATFIVRTATSDPLALAATLRREVTRARPDLRVANVRTQVELNQSHTVRERLLAMLASFFAAVALLLAGVGLSGVLHHTVLRQRRELGIRIALGARATHVARRVAVPVLTMVAVGAGAGLALGLMTVRSMASLFYEVEPTEPVLLTMPAAIVVSVALLTAVPPVVRALRVDPVRTLRAD